MLGPAGVAVEGTVVEIEELGPEFLISIWTGAVSLLALEDLLDTMESFPFALALSLGAFAIVVGGRWWKVVGTGLGWFCQQ
jgi:hypothetical protein